MSTLHAWLSCSAGAQSAGGPCRWATGGWAHDQRRAVLPAHVSQQPYLCTGIAYVQGMFYTIFDNSMSIGVMDDRFQFRQAPAGGRCPGLPPTRHVDGLRAPASSTLCPTGVSGGTVREDCQSPGSLLQLAGTVVPGSLGPWCCSACSRRVQPPCPALPGPVLLRRAACVPCCAVTRPAATCCAMLCCALLCTRRDPANQLIGDWEPESQFEGIAYVPENDTFLLLQEVPPACISPPSTGSDCEDAAAAAAAATAAAAGQLGPACTCGSPGMTTPVGCCAAVGKGRGGAARAWVGEAVRRLLASHASLSLPRTPWPSCRQSSMERRSTNHGQGRAAGRVATGMHDRQRRSSAGGGAAAARSGDGPVPAEQQAGRLRQAFPAAGRSRLRRSSKPPRPPAGRRFLPQRPPTSPLQVREVKLKKDVSGYDIKAVCTIDFELEAENKVRGSAAWLCRVRRAAGACRQPRGATPGPPLCRPAWPLGLCPGRRPPAPAPPCHAGL